MEFSSHTAGSEIDNATCALKYTHAHKHGSSWAIFLGEFASSFRVTFLLWLTAVRSERERVCACMRVSSMTTNTNLFYLLCYRFAFEWDGVYLSLDTFITPCLPIQRFTHGLCINLYAFFVFAAVHFSSPFLLHPIFANPLNAFVFLSIYQYCDWHTSSADSHHFLAKHAVIFNKVMPRAQSH